MEDKGDFNKICLCRLKSVNSRMSCVFLLVRERGGGTPSQRDICSYFQAEREEDREFLLCLLLLNCFQLKNNHT